MYNFRKVLGVRETGIKNKMRLFIIDKRGKYER